MNFCSECGNKITNSQTTNFCPVCGKKLVKVADKPSEVNQEQTQEAVASPRAEIKRTKNIGLIIGFVVLGTIGFIIGLMFFITVLVNISVVKYGYFYGYENVQVEELIESHIVSAKWSYEMKNDNKYVIVTGTAVQDYEVANIEIVFEVTGESFDLSSYKVNGVLQSVNDFYDLLELMYSKYLY